MIGLLALSSGVTWLLGTQMRSPRQVAAVASPPPPSLILADVAVRPLADEVSFDATLEPLRKTALSLAPIGGVVTRAPSTVGRDVRDGTVLAEVAGRPWIAMRGAFPSYRDLTVGTSGPDVRQLQAALRSAGIAVSPRDTDFGAATAEAVRTLYRRAGYPMAPGSAVSVRESELHFFATLPGKVIATNVRVGRISESSAITIGSGRSRLRGDVAATEFARLKVGLPAVIVSSSGTAPGVVEKVADPVSSEGRDSVAVTIRPLRAIKESAADASYRVRIVLAATSTSHPIVPVSALWAADVDRTVVTVSDSVRTRDVAVEVILVVDGWAAVRPVEPGVELRAGDRVVVGRHGDRGPGG